IYLTILIPHTSTIFPYTTLFRSFFINRMNICNLAKFRNLNEIVYQMDLNFNKNEDYNKLLLSELRQKFAKVKLGGGEKRIEKLHSQGKMSARERIDYLFDKDAKSIEIGAFAGEGMYKEHGGCPSGGVVVKIGYVKGKQVIVVA